ncbi:hypothetical protein PTNB73_01329 [Pyrenophora teres f. teres]|nr:hypothetical protein PTNB85_00076 [Pyrenophora teres f. teres]KAE8852313.1 hypothetical protein HRS9122_02600 [Pyrenophora teres f. teres]KAE8874697.1 hypothetical protein PTNB73_01329 [Pyrenophora teres f. teres]
MEVATERDSSRTNDTASTASTALIIASASAAPSRNNENDAPNAEALLHLVQRIITPVMESFIPATGRQDYKKIFDSIKSSDYIYIAPFVVGLFLIAEYQQPGFLPRPDETFVATVGFFYAGVIIVTTFALLEYEETHTWPWNDEGFIWPWEKWLWSCTVYNDESIGDSVASYKDDYLKSVTSLFEEEGEQKEVSVDFGRSGFEGRDDVQEPVQSTTPDGSPARPDIIIPPTPCLPGGLRPTSLASPPTHSSGLLGESPAPIRFKNFGRLLDEDID